jgi:hypothetical protein
MAVAKLCLETRQTIRDAEKETGIDRTRIAYALTVLHHAPSLVDLVISEEMGLDAAYKQALATKQTAEKEHDRLERLKRKAPDLVRG